MEHPMRWLRALAIAAALGMAVMGCSQSSGIPSAVRSSGRPADEAGDRVQLRQDEPSPATLAGPTSRPMKKAVGEVVWIDLRSKTLVMKPEEGEELSFALEERLAPDLEDLYPGEDVTVLYSEESGRSNVYVLYGG